MGKSNDDALRTAQIVLRIERERDAAKTREARLALALRETAKYVDEQGIECGDGKPCWCALPYMIPYRGHDAVCEEVRAALAEHDKEKTDGG